MVIKSISGSSGMDELTQEKGMGKRELWQVPHLTEKRERGTLQADHERAAREENQEVIVTQKPNIAHLPRKGVGKKQSLVSNSQFLLLFLPLPAKDGPQDTGRELFSQDEWNWSCIAPSCCCIKEVPVLVPVMM